MEGLLIVIALLVGALLAIAVAKAGLEFILSFVPAPGEENAPQKEGRDVQAART